MAKEATPTVGAPQGWRHSEDSADEDAAVGTGGTADFLGLSFRAFRDFGCAAFPLWEHLGSEGLHPRL